MLVSLRPAAANDWPAVAALLEANKLPLDGAREHLSNYLLATDDDEIVGCAGAEVYGSVALLRSVAVAPRLRGRRVGRIRLLAHQATLDPRVDRARHPALFHADARA
jgi:N-acetylglutamate synthase-like GNAT family acetyltransferase